MKKFKDGSFCFPKKVMTCSGASSTTNNDRRQIMGRLKRTPAAIGEPDYYRIEQVMFKLGCSENVARDLARKTKAQHNVDGYICYDYAKIKKYVDLCQEM